MTKEDIQKAYLEDMPTGDLTTDCLQIKEKYGVAQLIAKQDLILSGQECFSQAVHFIDPTLNIHWQFGDGDSILNQQTVAQIDGNMVQLIQAERVALNFLGYLSGIATQTHSFVQACAGTKTKILDTRKTLPLYRKLAKKAVVDGGGTNHRMNLSDAVLIKENHISLAGGLQEALSCVRAQTDKPIEIEVKNLSEVEQAVQRQADHIMLDNMTDEMMSEALRLIPEGIKSEASGNMTLARIPQVAALGVDFISVGALTHSVKNADLSLLFDWS